MPVATGGRGYHGISWDAMGYLPGSLELLFSMLVVHHPDSLAWLGLMEQGISGNGQGHCVHDNSPITVSSRTWGRLQGVISYCVCLLILDSYHNQVVSSIQCGNARGYKISFTLSISQPPAPMVLATNCSTFGYIYLTHTTSRGGGFRNPPGNRLPAEALRACQSVEYSAPKYHPQRGHDPGTLWQQLMIYITYKSIYHIAEKQHAHTRKHFVLRFPLLILTR
jgi:hypothetical protein